MLIEKNPAERKMTKYMKNPPEMQEPQETQVRSLGREDSPGGGHGNPLQYSCLENPQGQRRLVGYSPRGRKESDATGAEHNMYFFKPLSSSRHQPQTLPRLPSWDQSR